MCAPRRAAAVVWPRGREKSADRRRRILISRLLIIRASVPRRKSPFPAYFKGFPAVSPLIPPYPAFLKYPVSPQLSLKAKGLLSLMLSLPEDWDYTMKGLARICKDGIDSISGGIRELETHGYLVRARVRNENGQLGSIEYTILEQPKEPAQTPAPVREKPIRENPIQVKPMLDAPIQENPAQLNTKEQNKELSITQGSSPIPSSPPTPREKSRIGRDRMRERESYREIILENIDYDILTRDEKLDRDRLDELVELMVDTVCSNREMIRIAGDDYPAEVVKSRFLKIDSSHIEYVLERMRENTTYVRNIKKYLLAALYNAPVTMDSYYTSLVSHDLYGSGDRR